MQNSQSAFFDTENQLFNKLSQTLKRVSKCMLVIGSNGCGKSSLINYLSGYSYELQQNQQGTYSLKQKQVAQIIPTQIKYGTLENTKILIHQTKNLDDDNLAIIQMPSFIELNSKQSLQSPQNNIQNIYAITNVWNIVLSLVKQIHICLVAPYQITIQDDKLIHFFTTWYKCINIKEQQVVQKINNCISIILTKSDYQDDKDILLEKITHLAEEGQISSANTFQSVIENNRIYCFLAAESQAGQGRQLLQKILAQNQFQDFSKFNLLEPNWRETFAQFIVEHQQLYKSKYSVLKIQNIEKNFLQHEQKMNKIFDFSCTFLGELIIINFINIIPNNKQLENISKNIKKQLNESIQIPQIYKDLQNFIQKEKKINSNQYFNFLKQTNNIIKSSNSIINLFNQIQKTLISVFQIQKLYQSLMQKFLDYDNFFWIQSQCIEKAFQKHKQDHQVQQNLNILSSINTQKYTKFANLLRNKISSGLKKLNIFSYLSHIKQISESEVFKQLYPLYQNTQQGQQQIQYQQSVQIPTDSRINRIYYPTQSKPDIYLQIKQKSRKVAMKNIQLQVQSSERESIKQLLNLIQRQLQNRQQNLLKLAELFAQYGYYYYALQAYMDANKPKAIYEFLIQKYFKYIQETKQPYSHYQLMTNKLLPYLQQKSTIYENHLQATQFLYCLQACYDFMANNFAQSAQQFTQIMTFSFQLKMPNQAQCVISEEDNNPSLIHNTRSTDMPYLRYLSLSKAEIIEKINSRGEKLKKSLALFSQINKYFEATKITQVNKPNWLQSLIS